MLQVDDITGDLLKTVQVFQDLNPKKCGSVLFALMEQYPEYVGVNLKLLGIPHDNSLPDCMVLNGWGRMGHLKECFG